MNIIIQYLKNKLHGCNFLWYVVIAQPSMPEGQQFHQHCAHLNGDDNLLAVKLTDASFFTRMWITLIPALNAGILARAQVYPIAHKYKSIVRFSVAQRKNELMKKELGY